MKQNVKTTRWLSVKPAFTMIECILTAAVVVIVMVAIMAFRYYTVASAERAENQLLASRSAYLLSEAWRGIKADPAFDPTQQDFDEDFLIEAVSEPALVASCPPGSAAEKLQSLTGVIPLGSYRIRIDEKEFYAKLLYGTDGTVPNLRSTHILIVWRDHRGVRQEYYLPTLSQT